MTPPPVNAFIVPAGKWYGFCWRVVAVYPPEKHDQQWVVECERWGLRNGEPWRDEHRNHGWLRGLISVARDVWRDPFEQPMAGSGPMYYRLFTRAQKGQMELFA